jgi:apolipoprotein N-acyltransferase
VAGVSLTFAFAPFHLYYLAPLSLCLLLCSWLRSTTKNAVLNGFLFGLAFYGTSVYWVYISMHDFGLMPAVLAGPITLLFVAALASFFAVFGFLFVHFFRNENFTKYLLAFPAIWTLFEWVREWFLTGFPWMQLGYSQTASVLGRGFGPVMGVYGISFLVALMAGLIMLLLTLSNWKKRTVCILSLVFIWVVGYLLNGIHWTQPIGHPLNVSIIQGNIPQTIKWSPNIVKPTLDRYTYLTQKSWLNNDLIIWPEAAIPLPKPYADRFLNPLSHEAISHQTTLLTGIPIQVNENEFYNAAIAIGHSTGSYYKRHLVPFGEYIPFQKYSEKLFRWLKIPMSDFTPGPKKQSLINIQRIPTAIYLCYEIAFPSLVHSDFPEAQLLILLTDDAWFGRSIAADQHIQIAQMRSLETGRYTITATNNGITAVISPHGKIVKRLPKFKTSILNGQVIAMTGQTPWIYFGNTPILILLATLLGIAYKYRNPNILVIIQH